MSYERCAKTWTKLKKALKDEFEETVDSLQIHRDLSKRKKKTEETLQEYAYKMLQIAEPGKMEIQTVIHYIIEGIPDDAINKSMLYGAKDFRQLKEKFIHYEKMKQEMSKIKVQQPERRADKTGYIDGKGQAKPRAPGAPSKAAYSGNVLKKHCYNCGAEDHVGAVYPENIREKSVSSVVSLDI